MTLNPIPTISDLIAVVEEIRGELRSKSPIKLYEALEKLDRDCYAHVRSHYPSCSRKVSVYVEGCRVMMNSPAYGAHDKLVNIDMNLLHITRILAESTREPAPSLDTPDTSANGDGAVYGAYPYSQRPNDMPNVLDIRERQRADEAIRRATEAESQLQEANSKIDELQEKLKVYATQVHRSRTQLTTLTARVEELQHELEEHTAKYITLSEEHKKLQVGSSGDLNAALKSLEELRHELNVQRDRYATLNEKYVALSNTNMKMGDEYIALSEKYRSLQALHLEAQSK